jgi:hypothetical protein
MGKTKKSTQATTDAGAHKAEQVSSKPAKGAKAAVEQQPAAANKPAAATEPTKKRAKDEIDEIFGKSKKKAPAAAAASDAEDEGDDTEAAAAPNPEELLKVAKQVEEARQKASWKFIGLFMSVTYPYALCSNSRHCCSTVWCVPGWLRHCRQTATAAATAAAGVTSVARTSIPISPKHCKHSSSPTASPLRGRPACIANAVQNYAHTDMLAPRLPAGQASQGGGQQG